MAENSTPAVTSDDSPSSVAQTSTQSSSIVLPTNSRPTSVQSSSVGQTSAASKRAAADADPFVKYERQYVDALKNTLRHRKGVLTRYYGKAQSQLTENAAPVVLTDTLKSAKSTFDVIESTVDELFSYLDPTCNENEQRENRYLEVEAEYVKF